MLYARWVSCRRCLKSGIPRVEPHFLRCCRSPTRAWYVGRTTCVRTRVLRQLDTLHIARLASNEVNCATVYMRLLTLCQPSTVSPTVLPRCSRMKTHSQRSRAHHRLSSGERLCRSLQLRRPSCRSVCLATGPTRVPTAGQALMLMIPTRGWQLVTQSQQPRHRLPQGRRTMCRACMSPRTR